MYSTHWQLFLETKLSKPIVSYLHTIPNGKMTKSSGQPMNLEEHLAAKEMDTYIWTSWRTKSELHVDECWTFFLHDDQKKTPTFFTSRDENAIVALWLLDV